MSQPPDALRSRVLEEIARTPAPTRPQRKTFVARVVGVALAVVAIPFIATRGIVPGTRPAALIAFSVLSAAVLAVVLSFSALRSPRSMLGPPRRRLALVSVLSPALFVLLVGAYAAMWPATTHEAVSMHSDVLCALLMLLQGGALLAALMIAKRRTDPIHPALTGIAMGAVAGAWGFAFAYVRCPHVTVTHGLIAHVVPALALGAVGAVLGKRVLAER